MKTKSVYDVERVKSAIRIITELSQSQILQGRQARLFNEFTPANYDWYLDALYENVWNTLNLTEKTIIESCIEIINRYGGCGYCD